MAGRPRTISDTAILDAAERAIAVHGPTALTLAHVSAEGGLAPATLIQRFQTKRGLLLALAERAPGRIRAQFEASHADHPDSPLTALFDALSAIVPTVDSPAQLANVLAFSHLGLDDEAFRRAAAERSSVLHAGAQALLRQATAAGELLRHDSSRLAQAVYTTYTGSLLTWCVDGQGELSDWIRRDLDTLLTPYRPFGS
jgi:AcrR family transcriptional regulator